MRQQALGCNFISGKAELERERAPHRQQSIFDLMEKFITVVFFDGAVRLIASELLNIPPAKWRCLFSVDGVTNHTTLPRLVSFRSHPFCDVF